MSFQQPRTLLEQLIGSGPYTYAELEEQFARHARTSGSRATMSWRHLQRIAAGQIARPHPASARVLQDQFGLPIERLLGPPRTDPDATSPDRVTQDAEMLRRDFITSVVAASAGAAVPKPLTRGTNIDVLQEFTASISSGDPGPLEQVQTTYDVDRGIASAIDIATKKVLRRWATDLDNPIARVNATGILAKMPDQGESDRICTILQNDEAVRQLYLTAVTARMPRELGASNEVR